MPDLAAGSSTGAQRFVAAGVGAGVAEFGTLPVDAAKTRLQLQPPPAAAATPRYTGLAQSMYRIAVDDGARALWRGYQPALVRQVSYTGMSFALYEPIRNAVAGEGVAKEDIPFAKRVLAGGTAGSLSIVLMNPTDVVKTQMQAAQGEASPAMAALARNVYRGAGIGGFWRGWQPNVARCFVVNACEIGCYDEAKSRLVAAGVPDGPLGHFGASAIAGTVSALFSTPLDVVKTRLMAQAGGATTAGVVAYEGTLDCFVRMPRHEGLGALYKGFVPIAARKVVWTVAYFLCYEQALRLVRGSYS